MKVEEIIKLMEPRMVIGLMGPGLHRVEYTGWVMGAAQRKDLMLCEVEKIAQEIINGHVEICIYTKMP